MQKSIYIKYSEQEWWDIVLWLSALGKSLIAIEKNIDHCFKVSKIKWDLNTKVIETKKWSIIIEICLQIFYNQWIPFESITDLMDFLVMADYWKYIEYRDVFTNNILNGYENLEKFVSDHPLTYDIAKYFWQLIVGYFWIAKVAKAITISKTNINQPIQVNNYYCTLEQLQEIKSEVTKWSFNDVMLPLVEDEISQIELWTYDEEQLPKQWISITWWDLWWYLSEWQELLPAFIDDWVYNIPWRITAMQVSRWESMQFKANLEWKNRYLKLKSSNPVEDYRSDFNQDIILQAKVQRDSVYKKPTLILQSVSNVATPLFPID